MDSNNVLVPTNNLEELEKDYQEWLMLPMKFKLLSNSECENMYGCNIEELYHRLKNKILRGDETNNNIVEDDNNIVITSETSYIIESTINPIKDMLDSDKFEDNLQKSRELQKSPYIIIIDPCDDEGTMISKINSFNIMLNSKQKDLSNNYSWMIWEYNVINMYTLLKAYHGTNNVVPDSCNLVYESNSVKNLEDCVKESYDYLNKAKLEGDILAITKFEQTLHSDNFKDFISEAVTYNILKFLKNDKVDKLIFPKIVPWFTGTQMNKNSQKCSIKPDINYYRELKEAYNNYINDKSENNISILLSLGWNPTVPFNEFTIHKAMERQIEEASNTNCYNISKIAEYNDESLNSISYKDLNIKPIYFVFYDENVAVAFPNNYKISPNINILYKFNFSIDGTFCGFKRVALGDIDIKIVSIFVNNKVYDILYNTIRSNNIYENSDKFNSIYNVLLKSRNKLDPDRMKIVYSYYIDILLKLINIDPKSQEIVDARYIDSRYKTIFMLYSGKSTQYNPVIIDNIMRVICDENNLIKYLNDNEFVLDKELIARLKPEAIINDII